MKVTYALAALVAAAASVQASETNAKRMARGLNPLPPAHLHRASRTHQAKRTSPSGTPNGGNTCSTGPVQCCNSVGKASDNVITAILGLLGLGDILPDVLVGLQCSPLSVLGVGGGACKSRTVCCENNSHGGLISIGCIPIML